MHDAELPSVSNAQRKQMLAEIMKIMMQITCNLNETATFLLVSFSFYYIHLKLEETNLYRLY